MGDIESAGLAHQLVRLVLGEDQATESPRRQATGLTDGLAGGHRSSCFGMKAGMKMLPPPMGPSRSVEGLDAAEWTLISRVVNLDHKPLGFLGSGSTP